MSEHANRDVHTDGEDDDDDDDDDDVFATPTQFACTALAGATAGTIQHSVSYYTEVIELEARFSWKQFLKETRQLPLPPLRGALMASIPTGIGFVAYEFGREFSDRVLSRAQL